MHCASAESISERSKSTQLNRPRARLFFHSSPFTRDLQALEMLRYYTFDVGSKARSARHKSKPSVPEFRSDPECTFFLASKWSGANYGRRLCGMVEKGSEALLALEVFNNESYLAALLL